VKTTLLESWTGTPLRTSVVRRDVGTRKSENAVSCDYVAPPGRGSEVTCVLKHCPGLIRAHCGAAAYSASKAALNQLARVAALEWGEEGIRINSLHPDAVFDTGIWTEEVPRSAPGMWPSWPPRCVGPCSPRPRRPRCRWTVATTALSEAPLKPNLVMVQRKAAFAIVSVAFPARFAHPCVLIDKLAQALEALEEGRGSRSEVDWHLAASVITPAT
jgi:NAD(P)-dependent dehydrogenase (short-subunit alcohol dehydrogenase family)